MTPHEQSVRAVVGHESWPAIEEEFRKAAEALKKTDDMDLSGDPVRLQMELRARQLAAKTIEETLKYIAALGIPDQPVLDIARTVR